METITNVAGAASKLIWGEGKTQENETGGQEPISGAQGKGTVNEPFDKGNAENPITGTTGGESTTHTAGMPSTSTPSFANTNESTSTPSFADTNESTSTPSFARDNESTSTPSYANDSTPTTGPNTTSAAAGGTIRPEHETSKTGVIGNMTSDPKGSDVRPSESAEHPGAAPESGAAPFSKQQGAANPQDDPSTHEERKKSSTLNIDDIDGDEALKKKDPNDHSGEPMHMHDGAEEKTHDTIKDRQESKAGQAGGNEMGKEHGTGEQWVKTSGLAAEGGDFDATKPGAGREADRLMEQQGMHKTKPGEDPIETSSSPSGTKDKVSLSDKLKNKLHIGHKDKS